MTLFKHLNEKIGARFTAISLGVLLTAILFLISTEFIFLKNDLRTSGLTEEVNLKNVSYNIVFGNGNMKSYEMVPPKNATVFSLLEELVERENFKIEFKIYEEMGVLVQSIDGVKNGQDNAYWQYWVNGALPPIAADKKEVVKGDRVEWKFAIPSF